jgi:hypothetical protein
LTLQANNRLPRIYRPMKGVTEARRKSNGERHTLYCSPNITGVIQSGAMRWGGGACSEQGGGRRATRRAFVRKSERKRPLERPRHRQDIKMDLNKIKRGNVDYIHTAEEKRPWPVICLSP